MSEEILKPIDAMSNDELISILTIKKEKFNDEYKKEVVSQLNKRGVKFDELLKVGKYKLNNEETKEVDVNLAYEKLSLLKEPLDVLYFLNYMNEHLAIQKISNVFILHHYAPNVGFSSLFLEEETVLKNSIIEFLNFANWLPEKSEIIKHWETFAESTSSAYILRLANMLDSTDVVYAINSKNLTRFSSFNSPFSIVVPVEDIDEAEKVLTKIDELKANLYKQMELAEENGDVDLQLKLLMELESVTPDDAIMFYNKAQLLDEKGEYQKASEALIESFNIDFSNGIVDDIEDTEKYLVEMLNRVESKGNILHCLATISAYFEKNENIQNYYSQLIDLDENDSIAHLNLGHYYYSNTEDDTKVKYHFEKYLELEPESDECEAIKTILMNIA